MIPLYLNRFNAQKLANSIIFMDDVIPWAEIFVTPQYLRVFKSPRESGVHGPMTEKFICGEVDQIHRRDFKAFGNGGLGHAKTAFGNLEAFKLFVFEFGIL